MPMHATTWLRLACVFMLLPFVGCGFLSGEPKAGIYRAVLDVPAGELPFTFELADAGGSLAAFVGSGMERTAAEQVTRQDREYAVLLPGGATLTFTVRGNRLSGTARLRDASGDVRELPLSAERDAGYRFFPEPVTDNADVAGRWSMSIMPATGMAAEAVADFTQSHDQVEGKLHLDAGLPLAVTGQINDDDLRLASFDGTTAMLWAATVEATGDLQGSYWSSRAGEGRWQARRNPDAVIGIATHDADFIPTENP